ncbi:MAG: outer membrane lipoprotein-sorting protein [Verrucomicrobiota bacterium]
MSAFSQVKPKTRTRVIAVVCCALLFGGVAGPNARLLAQETEPLPDGAAILKSVRQAQASLHQVFQGKLRKGNRQLAYRMVMDGSVLRFEFPAAEAKEPSVVVVRSGAFDVSLEVRDRDGALLPVRFDEEVAGMGVTYEDLALRFLSWPGAVAEGDERLMLSKCWKLRVKRPNGSASGYHEVVLWVGQSNGAFLKSEAYGAGGVLLRRLTVRSLGTVNGMTTLKQLRIESPQAGGEPTYLDVDVDPTGVRPNR